mgnify:CR=1 FL=1
MVRSVLQAFSALIIYSLAALTPQTTNGQVDCRSSKQLHRSFLQPKADRDLAPMDILHQRITLDLTLGNLIAGRCDITAVPRVEGIDQFHLDLLALAVDSVTNARGLLPHSQSGEVLEVAFPEPIGTADTITISVHYRGDPAVDPSGFGGFYTSSGMTYNLGVAFESIPHSYGRSWFPCLDNFTERSTYEFLIKTAGGRLAYCNGSLIEHIPLGGDTVVSHWRIAETMPAYLASVAAANLAVARDTLVSTAGNAIPVELIAAANDTANMKASFTHLQDSFDHFEALFGPYRWERVGYVLTNIGAMEHATSIHYPRSIANGTLQNEDVMAHELAHHWFGNLVTCDRAEEMYINEGFAEYLSYLFLEDVYGRQRYMSTVRLNHRNMVHRAHLMDEGWWALNEVPQAWTYGEHSYNKGADVLHSLRGYLGDEAFSAGLTSFLTTYAFQPVNTELLRDHLSMATGVDLTDFFTDWIQQPGWTAFEIDAQTITPINDAWSVDLTIGQKQRGPAAAYHHVPITIAVIGADPANVFRDTVLVGGASSAVSLTVPFEPAWVWLNDDDKLSLAMTGETDTISTTSIFFSSLANLEVRPQFAGDPVIVRLEQYWVAADEGTVEDPFAYVISPDRYWRVSGNWTDASRFIGRIFFDGRNTTSGNLDVGLMQDHEGVAFHEDSLVLLFRATPTDPWVFWSDRVTTFGSPTDKYGRMDTDSLRVGEYVLAWRRSAVGLVESDPNNDQWTIHPNPATDHINIRFDKDVVKGRIRMLDNTGREVASAIVQGRSTRIDVLGLVSGSYVLQFIDDRGNQGPTRSIVIGH